MAESTTDHSIWRKIEGLVHGGSLLHSQRCGEYFMNIQHYEQRLLDLEKTLSARIGHEATRAGENSSTRPMTPQLQIVNAASLPQNKMMRGIDAVGARVVPALHREDIDRSRAAEISDGHT